MTRGRLLVLLGALGVVIGAVLPWVSITSLFGTVAKAGYDGDGLYTGAVGLLLLIGAALRRGKAGRMYSIASSLFALIVGAIAVWDLMSVVPTVAEVSADSDMIASVGAGLYVTLAGAILSMVGGIVRVPAEMDRRQ